MRYTELLTNLQKAEIAIETKRSCMHHLVYDVKIEKSIIKIKDSNLYIYLDFGEIRFIFADDIRSHCNKHPCFFSDDEKKLSDVLPFLPKNVISKLLFNMDFLSSMEFCG